jgi:hypothetical protein
MEVGGGEKNEARVLLLGSLPVGFPTPFPLRSSSPSDAPALNSSLLPGSTYCSLPYFQIPRDNDGFTDISPGILLHPWALLSLVLI